MTKTTCRIIASICACTFALASGVALATDPAPPVKLSIREPVKHNKAGGFVEGRDWNLEFRLTVPTMPWASSNSSAMATRSKRWWFPTRTTAWNSIWDIRPIRGPFDASCGDSVVEEVYFPFRSDPNDRSGVADIDQCDFLIEQPRLQDDPSTTPSSEQQQGLSAGA